MSLYTDATLVLQAHPDLTPDKAHAVARIGERPLKPIEQRHFWHCFNKAMTTAEICQKCSITVGQITVTRLVDPAFRKRLRKAQDEITKTVEQKCIQYATGCFKKTKLTYTYTPDENGDPQQDSKGKTIMHLHKKEVEIQPPQPQLVMFYLKSHMPSVYGDTREDDYDNITPADVVKKLEAALPKLKVVS